MKKLKTMTTRIFLYALLLFCIPILSCEKLEINGLSKTGGEKTQCITVSYNKGICREAVLKIEDPAFYGMGESWGGEDHVFFTVLGCEINVEALLNKKFSVLVSDRDSSDKNCIACQATLAYSGTKKYFITLCN
ncbi:MAG: hypothetical protein ACKOC0_04035 [Cytophagales bacterium]